MTIRRNKKFEAERHPGAIPLPSADEIHTAIDEVRSAAQNVLALIVSYSIILLILGLMCLIGGDPGGRIAGGVFFGSVITVLPVALLRQARAAFGPRWTFALVAAIGFALVTGGWYAFRLYSAESAPTAAVEAPPVLAEPEPVTPALALPYAPPAWLQNLSDSRKRNAARRLARQYRRRAR